MVAIITSCLDTVINETVLLFIHFIIFTSFTCLVVTSPEPPCEDYSDLCYYEQSMFDLQCFGDCGRSKEHYDPFSRDKIDAEDIWEECNAEVEITARYFKLVVAKGRM